MASPQRLTISDLIALTQARDLGEGDNFFEQVRCLERHARLTDGSAARLGADGPPAAEPVRFRAAQEPVFADRTIEQVDTDSSTTQLAMAVTVLGLTGPSGVLPAPYGALIRARLRQRDHGLADFFDIFNHRLIALYYRAWAKYRVAAEQELAAITAPPFTDAVRALAGDTAPTPDPARLFYAGHFAGAHRSASALARLTTDFLGIPTAVDGFIGQWLPLAEPDRLQIGSSGYGRNNRLGAGILPGHRVWDMQSRFALRIGPLSSSEFDQLLPGTERFAALARLLRDYAPAHLDIELHYLVRSRSRTCLDGSTRLGRNSWLCSRGDSLRRARIQLRRHH